ncbi:hypothetical protein [Paenibacillus agilis]|uniref:Uncharacterized protein n=1 Tax=Paenibacillus agilis TaxID=3020863 RepID=A0A559IF00_9BACL|nr:hypothetical protein [Paenibacillus agilis]TVX86090.1 hypothetical protein FPZ44_24450 [Paenibacillus agilis]
MATFEWGNVNIRGEVKIELGINDLLSFDVDGIPYSITLDTGTYVTVRELHTSEFVEALSQKVIAQQIPIDVLLGGSLDDQGKVNYIVFNHKNPNGKITNFRGTMKSLIFK